MFEYTFSDLKDQLISLPILFRLWFYWLGLIILIPPFAFLRHRQGKVTAIYSIIFIPIQLLLLKAAGISYLISFLHLALWIPLIFYLLNELKNDRINLLSPIGIWSLLAVLTLNISLIFDIRDSIRWLAGARGIIEPAPTIYLPWVIIPGIILAIVLSMIYIFRSNASKKRTS
jgi:hypothetical protein